MQDRELLWFENPRRRRRKAKRRRKLYGAAAAAHRKKANRSKRKRKRSSMRGHATAHKRRKHVARRKLYGAAAKAHARRMARGGSKRRGKRRRSHGKRRHRITSRAVARRAGRQLRYRRANPPFGRGIVGQITNGAVDALEIIAGKVVARTVPTLIPGIPQAGAFGLAVQVAGAVVAGYVGKFISPSASRMMLAGGLAAPIESWVKSLSLPYVSAALADTPYYAVGDYPKASLPGVSDYVHDYPRGMAGGDVLSEDMSQMY